MNLEKTYNPKKIEKKWYNFWIENNLFTPSVDHSKKPFTILIPPPNVTGILHMGHVLNNTIQDVIIRYKRSKGYQTLWLPGTDHAGIATQNVVERQLKKMGKTRNEIGRTELIKRIWKWKEQKGEIILEQLKKLGCSCDWSRLRFTMDKGLSEAVKEVFIRLYKKGLIYKGERIINWCPRCTTALANDEVEFSNEDSKLWYVAYPIAESQGEVIIATTRPETMLADVAVAANPNDERYKHLKGKSLVLPIVNKKIPFILDGFVDKTFGTGCVKITPAHDVNDFEIGKRHNLDEIVIIDKTGKMNKNAGEDLQGMDCLKARSVVVKKLKKMGLIRKIEDYKHSVGHCYRCNSVIEPYLSNQWFVSMKPLATPAIKVIKNGKITLQPKRWIKVYLHWMENIRDWCISRQIWWGHRIPAFYCQTCSHIEVAKEKPQKCSKCGASKFVQDSDVLDTWFSSALWPFSTLGWPKRTNDLDYFLPTNVLVTAPEIIYLWVARMIMTTIEFENKIPFNTVLLHGIVRDEKGRKMSKSLGNSPDPIKIIETTGADSLRFAMIYHTPKGEDSYYSKHLLETGRNFCNKIWNAFRFILSNIDEDEKILKREDLTLTLADRWIYARLNQVIINTTKNYEKLRLNDVAAEIQEFFWKEYCSWFLELSKDRIYSENPQKKKDALYILLDILKVSMKLLQPIMPFITEEIFQVIIQYLPEDSKSIVKTKFPEVQKIKNSKDVVKNMELLQQVITTIRNMKKRMNISPGKEVEIVIKTVEKRQTKLFEKNSRYLFKLARVSKLTASVQAEKPKNCLADVASNVQIFLPLDDIINKDTERQKLNKQIKKLSVELKSISSKLSNKNFLNRAPANIVDKERGKFKEVSQNMEKIKLLLAELE